VGRLTGSPADAAERAAPRIVPIGDAALLVVLGEAPDAALTERAHELAVGVEARRGDVPAIGRPVPAHASVLVPFDPLATSAAEVERVLHDVLATRPTARPSHDDEPPLEIAVRYGGPDGPDLEAVAASAGLTPDEVVALHAGATFRVLFLGFAPGFAYLGGLPPELEMPRRTTPREQVPAGSVGIAGAHSAVYPLAMPGGWNLIGRAEAILFDPRRDPPTPLRPGLAVRFVPRGPDEVA
jgi:KipI family sensor histidine kinase inhibitor